MIICEVDFLLTPGWVRPSSDFCVRMIFRLDRDLGFYVKKKVCVRPVTWSCQIFFWMYRVGQSMIKSMYEKDFFRSFFLEIDDAKV
jgi:hypothetical protein